MSQQKTLMGKWGLKKWFTVYAPAIFNAAEIGEVPSDDPRRLLGRTIEVSLFDLTKDLGHLHVKLKFQINEVDSGGARTVFKLMELTRDYLKSLIRRGSSLISLIQDLETVDGARLRVTVLAVTPTRCKTSQKRAIRAMFRNELLDKVGKSDFASAVRAMVFGDLANNLFVVGKKIYPLRKVEIAKVKVLKLPSPPKAIEEAKEVTVQTT